MTCVSSGERPEAFWGFLAEEETKSGGRIPLSQYGHYLRVFVGEPEPVNRQVSASEGRYLPVSLETANFGKVALGIGTGPNVDTNLAA